MRYLQTIAPIATFLDITSAVPSERSSGKQRFSITQVDTGRRVPRNIDLARNKFLSRYGSLDSVKLAAGDQGTVTAIPENAFDTAYLSPVIIGGQELMMVFDTGSADLWCFSSELSPSENAGHAYYNPALSFTSSRMVDYTWSILYGDKSYAAGDVYADTVVVGSVTATSQAVGVATQVSAEFRDDTQIDGLVGFAGSAMKWVRPVSQLSWFDMVRPDLDKQLFSVSLKYHGPGTWDFGHIDSQKYVGEICYAPITGSLGFWQFAATGYSVDGYATSGTFQVIADTGTSLMYLPDHVVEAYYAQIKGSFRDFFLGSSSEYYIFNCSSTPPDFAILINGGVLNVPGQYINSGDDGNGICMGGLQASGGGMNILGDPFFKGLYVIHDVGASRIGFATQSRGFPSSNDTFAT